MDLTLPSKYVSKAVTYTNSHNKQHFRLLRPRPRSPVSGFQAPSGANTGRRLLGLASGPLLRPGVSDIILVSTATVPGCQLTPPILSISQMILVIVPIFNIESLGN